MNKIIKLSLVAALAGFLFGFDTVVISGADQKLQALWNSSDGFHGAIVMGMALWGTVIGALFGGFPTNKLGRKNTLMWIGVLYSVSAIGSALANDPISFALFRFIGGLGVGASTIAAPAYISEIAPAKDRGRLVGFYQFMIVFGILVAYFSNYLIGILVESDNNWRWMVGIEALPAIIYTLLSMTIPKSPRWLVAQFRSKEAEQVLVQIGAEIHVNDLISDHEKDQSSESQNESVLSKKYRFPLILAILLAFFNQFSGINAFLYYAPRIFELAGLEASSALLSSIGIGVTNLIFTLIGINLIDRLGRKTLMYWGSFGYIISLALVAMAFHFEWKGMAVPGFLFLFIAAHAIGQGTVIWVYISEVFPNHLRSAGQSWGTSTHWVLAAIIPSLVPILFNTIGIAPVFGFFAFMMILQLVFVRYMMPETKGVSLEELAKKLSTKN